MEKRSIPAERAKNGKERRVICSFSNVFANSVGAMPFSELCGLSEL